MKNFILIFSLAIILSGCSIGNLKPTVVSDPITLITTTLYPEFADMSKPPKLGLNNPQWDIPRDMNALMTVKRLTQCYKVPEEDQDNDFWAECGEHPPVKESNIYRGYSYDDFNLFLLNNAAIRAQIKSYEVRIDQVNKQRKEWREKNAAAREKLVTEKAKAEAKNKNKKKK